MSEDVKPETIKGTQDVLGKFIKKPILTEKLLKKPPFRFLHDICTAAMKETGIFSEVMNSPQYMIENIKDKEGKIAFLQKVIAAVEAANGVKLTVKPNKIVAGLEPTKTNEFLQALGKAMKKQQSENKKGKDQTSKTKGSRSHSKETKEEPQDKKHASNKAPKTIIENGIHDITGNEKKKKSIDGSKGISPRKKPTTKAKADDANNKAQEKQDKKPQDKKLKEKPVDINNQSREVSPEKKLNEEITEKKKEYQGNNIKQPEAGESLDVPKIEKITVNGIEGEGDQIIDRKEVVPDDVIEQRRHTGKQKHRRLSIHNTELATAPEPSRETEENDREETIAQVKKDEPLLDNTAKNIQRSDSQASIIKHPETKTNVEKRPESKTIIEKRPESKTITEKRPESKTIIQKYPESKAIIEKPPESKINSDVQAENKVGVERRPERKMSADMQSENQTTLNKRPESKMNVAKHNEKVFQEQIKPQPSPSPGPTNYPKKEPNLVREGTVISRPRTGIRPTTARPASARPAAPRIRERNDVVVEEASKPTSGKVNVVNVIVDKDVENEPDDDNLISLETTHDMLLDEITIPPMSEAASVPNDGEHGHLVEQILEVQKELEDESKLPFTEEKVTGKTEIEWETNRNSKAAAWEIEKLRANIQTLTRSVNPLGKLLDFFQEDVESIQKELETWKGKNSSLAVQIANEKSITEQFVEPLKIHLKEIQQSIDEQFEQISVVKANIIRNNKKIRKLLASG